MEKRAAAQTDPIARRLSFGCDAGTPGQAPEKIGPQRRHTMSKLSDLIARLTGGKKG